MIEHEVEINWVVEDYITIDFVRFLKDFLEDDRYKKDRWLAEKVLRLLCKSRNGNYKGTYYNIRNQVRIGKNGRLDLRIGLQDRNGNHLKIVYVECKDFSAVKENQIINYSKHLDKEEVAPEKLMVLLYRPGTDIKKKDKDKVHHFVYWYQLLAELQPKVNNLTDVGRERANQFIRLLKEKNMNLDRVKSPVFKQLKATANLIELFSAAMKNAELTLSRKQTIERSNNPWVGVYGKTDGREFSLGVYGDNPDEICLTLEESPYERKCKPAQGVYELKTADEQVESLRKFILKSIKALVKK